MKTELKILLIVLLSLILVIAYSFLPADSKLVKLSHIKQMDVEQFVQGDTVVSVSDQLAQRKEPVFGDKPDSVHVRALLFGDSMGQFLCNSFSNYMNANGMESASIVWYSSSTRLWAECDTLQYFLKKLQPTHIFIVLGANELFKKDLPLIRSSVKTIIAKCGDRPVIWIGPANWKEDTGINDIIRENMGERAYFCSKHLDLPRLKDKMHPSRDGSDIWMDSIAAWINTGKTVFPYRLKKPTEYNREAVDHIFLSPLHSKKHNDKSSKTENKSNKSRKSK